MADGPGTPAHFVKMNLGFCPSPSGGALALYQEEEVHSCWLTLRGYGQEAGETSAEFWALITIRGVVQTVFGYPNEESYLKDDRGLDEVGIFELVGSAWPAKLQTYNDATFGASKRSFGHLHHFFVGSKDVSVQALAQDLELELFEINIDIQLEALRRLRRYRYESPPLDAATEAQMRRYREEVGRRHLIVPEAGS